MKAKLIVEGKEFDIDILNPELEKLVKPHKKTGYERADTGREFWSVERGGEVHRLIEANIEVDNGIYDIANYYSNQTVAVNNARADKLMRQLRRFAVEHRESDLGWSDSAKDKYFISYNHDFKKLVILNNCIAQHYGIIHFDSAEATNLAIKTFHDELIWYFTEYKDSL